VATPLSLRVFTPVAIFYFSRRDKCVTTYLYGSLNSDDYMKLPEEFNFLETYYQNYWRDDIICPF